MFVKVSNSILMCLAHIRTNRGGSCLIINHTEMTRYVLCICNLQIAAILRRYISNRTGESLGRYRDSCEDALMAHCLPARSRQQPVIIKIIIALRKLGQRCFEGVK